MTVRLVCGPPAAGKTGYVRTHAADSDIVVDLDDLRDRFGYAADDMRASLESRDWGDSNVWFIRTLADPAERGEAAQRLSADVTVLATPEDVCLARSAERGDPEDVRDAITNWWATYQQSDTDTTITRQEPEPMPKSAANTAGKTPTENTAPDETSTATENAGAGTSSTAEDSSAGSETEIEVNEHGFPDGTAIADMAPEHQAAYWKHKARKHEQRANAAHTNSGNNLSQDQIQQMIDNAVGNARADEKRNGALALARVQVSNALASAGRTEDQCAEIIGTLDLTKFLSDTDEVVADKVTAFAGSLGSASTDTTRHMGNRSSGASAGVEAGAAMFADRRKK